MMFAVREVGEGQPQQVQAEDDTQGTLQINVASSSDPVTLEEIEAILLAESCHLPPESHLPAPPPMALAQRTPGTGRMGRLPVVFFLLFVLMSIWQTMK